jgi:hypothetical protein
MGLKWRREGAGGVPEISRSEREESHTSREVGSLVYTDGMEMWYWVA